MKPPNSGISISLAVFCLLFQNVSSISMEDWMSVSYYDILEFNELQEQQQEWWSIRDVEEDNSLQNVIESLSKKYVLENAEPRNCSDEVEIIRMVPVLWIVVIVSSLLVILIVYSAKKRRSSISGDPSRLKDRGPSSTLVDCLIKMLQKLKDECTKMLQKIDDLNKILQKGIDDYKKMLQKANDDYNKMHQKENDDYNKQPDHSFSNILSSLLLLMSGSPPNDDDLQKYLLPLDSAQSFYGPFGNFISHSWAIISTLGDTELNCDYIYDLPNTRPFYPELLRPVMWRKELFGIKETYTNTNTNNPLEYIYISSVDHLKGNIITSKSQGQMSMCDKFADWILCNFKAIIFLLVVMSLPFPFLLPYTGHYFTASIVPTGDLELLNCLKCSHENVFTSEFRTSEDPTASICTSFFSLLSSSLYHIFGELEKLRKPFTRSQVIWAVTWIFLLAFLFYYVSQINNNDNGVCSNKVSEMILALPIKKLVLLFVLIMSTGFASASNYCAENQTAEIDAPGMINCSFPETVRRVVWFDDVSKNSSFAISCEAPCSVKKGPGLQYYDIFQNGSLRIPRVTVQQEKPYEVFVYTSQDYFEKQTVYLKVIARPGQRLPTLDYNGKPQYHYHKVNGKANLTCSFNATRPPVQLTWLQRTDEGDIPVKQQDKTVIENKDGTFNSSVTIDLTTTPMENRMLLFVCKANWNQQGWEEEKEILLDNRGLQSFEGEPNETIYMEQGRQANVRCKGSIGFLQLWEKISSNNEPDMIGFMANGLTRAVATSQDTTVSSEGHLIFSSPQVDDEGIYVCSYSHGMHYEVYVVAVTILIAPLPPYIHIKGCKDDNQACSLKAYDQGQISCFVMGVRPSVSLEWIASDARKIALHASKETTKEQGSTSDTELSVEYELISENINCGDNVYVTCRLSGPVSHIINRNERNVQLTREPCRPVEDKGDGFSTVLMIVIILCSILVVGLCISVLLIFKCYLKRKAANGSHSNMAAERIPMNVIEKGKLTEGKAQSCGPA